MAYNIISQEKAYTKVEYFHFVLTDTFEKIASSAYSTRLPHNGDETPNIIEASAEYDVCF